MKKITLKLRKELLLIELPEGAELVGHKDDKLITRFKQGKNYATSSENLSFKCELIASFHDIPESYWEVVIYDSDDYAGRTISPLKSVIYAIKAQGWLLENPFGSYDENIKHGDSSDFFKEWQEAQSKVIDLNNVWVFERKEVENGNV